MRAALVLGILLLAAHARADRGLRGALQSGQRLRVELETPHGLTPPPGIQNERALRGFAARLCAPARCVPLDALNVRPRDGWSLIYRAEFALPAELTPGHYELEVRFPGGQVGLPGGVTIDPMPAPAVYAPAAAAGCAVATPTKDVAPLGLLLVVISRKLAAARRARSLCGNSPR